VQPSDFEASAQRFFKCFVQLQAVNKKVHKFISQIAFGSSNPLNLVVVNDKNLDLTDPTWCISVMPSFAARAIYSRQQAGDLGVVMNINYLFVLIGNKVQVGDHSAKWGVVVVGPTYLFGILGWVPAAHSSEGSTEFSQDDLRDLVAKANNVVEGEKGSGKSLSFEIGKGKGLVPAPSENAKEKVALPDWTVTFRCSTISNTKLVIDFFVKQGFVILDI
jgi:hypothetical protein